MLTPLQAYLSAILTALIVQYLSIKFTIETSENKSTKLDFVLDRTIPKTLLLPTSSPDDQPPLLEVNKLLDAIFISHGIEIESFNEFEKSELPEKRKIVDLDESNFSLVYTGDWLILAHVPWYPGAKEYFNHFITEFTSIPLSSPINLATIDCHSHPLLAATLNVRQYPSLHLVTLSGRLRDWPFELKPLDQVTLSFIVNGHWKHLPAYQLLKSLDYKEHLFPSFIQIKAFNAVTSLTSKSQPIIFDWIVNNRPLTGGILSCLSLAAVLLSRKIQ